MSAEDTPDGKETRRWDYPEIYALPGGSVETAIPLTTEQAESLRKAGEVNRRRMLSISIDEGEAEAIEPPNSALVAAGENVIGAYESLTYIPESNVGASKGVWVRSETPVTDKNPHTGENSTYNTWHVNTKPTAYGVRSNTNTYMVHPDGRQEVVTQTTSSIRFR